MLSGRKMAVIAVIAVLVVGTLTALLLFTSPLPSSKGFIETTDRTPQQEQSPSQEVTPSSSPVQPSSQSTDTLTLARLSAAPPAPSIKIEETNGIKHLSPRPRILSGGPPKDGIPSIDRPRFISASEADQWLGDDAWVVGIKFGNTKKAYPLQILVWHEIVNEKFEGIPIVVTYCPLCFSSIAFYGVIDGEPVEFGTSGKLYNSDLVMYDRKTDTYWGQILGLGLEGELAGYELKRVPLDAMRWKDWKALYPDTLVLSRDTGFSRSYGVDPYGSYYTDPGFYFPIEHRDDRLFEKEIIFGVNLNEANKAYTNADLADLKVVNDIVGGKPIVLFSPSRDMVRSFSREVDGRALTLKFQDGNFYDKETDSQWNFDGTAVSGPLKGTSLEQIPGYTSFWFAFAAFYQGTDLYGRSA